MILTSIKDFVSRGLFDSFGNKEIIFIIIVTAVVVGNYVGNNEKLLRQKEYSRQTGVEKYGEKCKRESGNQTPEEE